MNNLDTLHYSPRRRTIEAILQYAEDTAPAENTLETK
jgi:hypothetical protein